MKYQVQIYPAWALHEVFSSLGVGMSDVRLNSEESLSLSLLSISGHAVIHLCSTAPSDSLAITCHTWPVSGNTVSANQLLAGKASSAVVTWERECVHVHVYRQLMDNWKCFKLPQACCTDLNNLTLKSPTVLVLGPTILMGLKYTR